MPGHASSAGASSSAGDSVAQAGVLGLKIRLSAAVRIVSDAVIELEPSGRLNVTADGNGGR